ncbi:hypothetical protein [Curtobacterium aurantiacum]|uniref:hypothetical protein n=1 Tax=Curtobacterium aurantiacum TaxID=3236919 RepID=UPI001BE02DD2|nr:hypothetical protein [Curtobacterium flaccumfaciens]MBT1676004.1 hypothetical protein [Curtobacterium flaccumfaciens pv. flaccumfaciens]
MAGITISLLSNVRDVVRGAKETEGALDDVADALDDLAREGKRTGQELGDGITDGMDGTAREAKRQGDKIGDALADGVGDGTKEAGKDVDQLERKFRELAEATKRTDLSPGPSIAKTTKQGMSEASESVQTFSDEAKSNLSEVASSFTGDTQSVVDLLQGTLGGVIADLGPLGLAAGTAGAAAIGLIGQAFVQAGEDQEAFKERVKTMTQELVDEFADTGDAVSAIDEKLRQWASDNERYGVSLVDLRKDAKLLDVGFDDLATTIAGGTTKELRRMQEQVEESEEKLRREAATLDTTANAHREGARAAGENAERLRKDVLPAIEQQIEANENAAAAQEALAKANGMTVEQYEAYVDATNRSKEATEAFADSLSTTLADAAESSAEALDNRMLNTDKYLTGLQERTDAALQYKANVQAIGEQLPADLFNFVREQGPGFSREIATYLSATPAQQEAIRAGWSIDAQVTADTSNLDATTDAKGKETKKGPTSKVQGDTSDLDKKTDQKAKEKNPGPTSKLRADTSDVDDAIKKLKGQKVDGPTVVYKADTSALDDVNRRIANNPVTQIVNQRIGKRVA